MTFLSSHKKVSIYGILLLIIIAGGTYLRFSALDFGLPNYQCKPDETAMVDNAIKVASGKLNPKFFKYPTFQIYINTILFGAYFVIGRLLGIFGSVKDFVAQYLINPSNLYLIARAFSAATGAATIYIAYKTAAIADDKKAGLVSAFLLATNYLHARESHFAVTDIFMTFLICAAFYYILMASLSHKKSNYIIGAVLTGLAASVKYNGGVLAFVFIFAFIISEHSKDIKGLFKDKYFYIYPVVILAAFFAGSPYILLDFSFFLEEFLFQMNQLKGGHLGIDLGSGFLYHLKFSLYYGMGALFFAVSIASILFLIFNVNKQRLILLFYIFIFYFFMGKGKSVFMRYMLPMIPFLCVSSGIFISRVIDKIKAAAFKKNALIIAVAALITINPTMRILQTNALLKEEDTRNIAARYIRDNIKEGSGILLTAYFASPMLNQSTALLEKEYDISVKKYPKKSYDKLKLLTELTREKKLLTYNIFRAVKEPAMERSEFPYDGVTKELLIENNIKYIVLDEYFLNYYKVPDALVDFIQNNGKLIKVIPPLDEAENTRLSPIFDPIDLFYLPVDGLRGFNRPGPTIMIYEM